MLHARKVKLPLDSMQPVRRVLPVNIKTKMLLLPMVVNHVVLVDMVIKHNEFQRRRLVNFVVKDVGLQRMQHFLVLPVGKEHTTMSKDKVH